jgi:hypothetical protein
MRTMPKKNNIKKTKIPMMVAITFPKNLINSILQISV